MCNLLNKISSLCDDTLAEAVEETHDLEPKRTELGPPEIEIPDCDGNSCEQGWKTVVDPIFNPWIKFHTDIMLKTHKSKPQTKANQQPPKILMNLSE